MMQSKWLLVSALSASVFGCSNSSSDGGGGAGSGGEEKMVTVEGTVKAPTGDDKDDTPVEGAKISIIGSSKTATTDKKGEFSIQAPEGSVLFKATADDNWGTIIAMEVPKDGVDDLELEVVPDEMVEEIGDALKLDKPIDETDGMVNIVFDPVAVASGDLLVAAIDQLHSGSFTINDDGEIRSGQSLEDGDGNTVALLNVDLNKDVKSTSTISGHGCSHLFDESKVIYPTQAKVITTIDILCPDTY